MNKKEQILALLAQGKSYSQIAEELHCSKGTIGFHAKNLGLTKPYQKKSGKRYDWDEIRQYCDEGHGYSDCARKFGISLTAWEDALKKGKIAKIINLPIEQLLVIHDRLINLPHFRQRLIDEGVLEYKCKTCGIYEWNNSPLVLELDHINGNRKDNRLENLRLLCPNCHSQTKTFRAKNIKSYLARQDHESNGLYLCNQCTKREGKPVLKQRSEFYQNRGHRHGLDNRCKDCADANSRQRRSIGSGTRC